MNIETFKSIIEDLFEKEFQQFDDDEYGFTYIADRQIGKIGYCTNLSIETIEKASSLNVDLLLTHHDAWPFIHGLSDACLSKLKENNMTHFFIHSPLDFAKFGTCTSLMNVIGIDSITQHSYYENGEYPGIGVFNHPSSFHELVEKMRHELKEPVRFWKNNSLPVKKIGMITGAGHSTDYIKLAVDAGCDTYITGEASLYSIQYAEFAGINLIVGSHTYTEMYGVRSLAEKIREFEKALEIVQIEERHFELNH
jgi:dinuclear metal center YbgI/SA1388 family protein